MSTHDSTTRRVFGVSHETIVKRILRTFDSATASDLEAGARWYPRAGQLASDLAAAGVVSTELAAIVISHLSPRTDWARNVAGATALLVAGERPESVGCMGDTSNRAVRACALAADGFDPWDSFGPTARKTRSFARNILGDCETVTVDVWAMRVVGLDETRLGRVGAYDAIAHAYRLAARRRGVDPATMQATTWVVARNGRSE